MSVKERGIDLGSERERQTQVDKSTKRLMGQLRDRQTHRQIGKFIWNYLSCVYTTISSD